MEQIYNILLNEFQTPIEELNLDKCPQEVREQFFDCLLNVPYIKTLTSPDRKRARDLPKDNKGRIIINVTQPHILEDTDYFRPSAIKFQKDGRYTDLRPNPNPNSEYGKWIREEIRRCYEGYVRDYDGEWITGDMYFFLNYCQIQLADTDDQGNTIRVVSFPQFWEGHYYKFHYLNQCRNEGLHALELASRGRGKSYCGAAMLAKRFVLGESARVKAKVQCLVTASEKKYLTGGNQILDMFQYYIDFLADNTQFPYKRLTSSLGNMQWTMGYMDMNTGTRRGTQNSVMGITSKDDESKLRGTRGVLYLIEEAGTFSRLNSLLQVLKPSVQDGSAVWGLIYVYGTAGDNESDFSAMQEFMYNPKGYDFKSLPNVYDKEGQGGKDFTFFFPGYMNMARCYNKDGVSDVTKALLEILLSRYNTKHNSTDLNAITKKIAEVPITPQEAVLKSRGNMFPITELNERLYEIDNNPNFYDDTYVGDLVLTKDGKVEFRITNDTVIRDFPLKDNKAKGAVEIYQMPEKDKEGKVYRDRYIMGHDPVDSDVSGTMSLSSTFVLDLFTDKIVAEYTGRSEFADDNYEKVRLLCMFYNAKCLYENNLKGLYSYFSRLNCTHLLADTPEYLKDKQLIKSSGWGNAAKGVTATVSINNYANELIKAWLLTPVPTVVEDAEGQREVNVHNLYFIKNRALLRELIAFNPFVNVDRVRALGILMLYREEKLILYRGDVRHNSLREDPNFIGNDDFFTRNYDEKFANSKFNKTNIFFN